VELIAEHGVRYGLFADDKQLYTAVPSDEIHVACQRLTTCVGVLRGWCVYCRLQLNASKTKLIRFGTRISLLQNFTQKFAYFLKNCLKDESVLCIVYFRHVQLAV